MAAAGSSPAVAYRSSEPGSGDLQVNVMYSQLLEAVLDYEEDPDARSRSQGPLADVLRLRHVMDRNATRTDPGWALQAVADQLAYDAALIRLARRRGIQADPSSFEAPEHGRVVIEDALIAKGVNLPRRSADSGHSVDPG